MNCDYVFDILTRGPFPSGDPIDTQVEAHLSVCHPCRQMAEALRPAVDLFHEAVTPEEFHGLPEYRGRMVNSPASCLASSVDAIVSSTISMELPKRRRYTPAKPPKPTKSRPIATLVGISLALFVLLQASGFLQIGSFLRTAGAGPVREGEPNAAGLRLLKSLDLPSNCLEPQDKKNLSRKIEKQSTRLFCCTDCHSANFAAYESVDIAVLAKSCRACHTM